MKSIAKHPAAKQGASRHSASPHRAALHRAALHRTVRRGSHVCSLHKPKHGDARHHKHGLRHKRGCICVFCTLLAALFAASCGSSESPDSSPASSVAATEVASTSTVADSDAGSDTGSADTSTTDTELPLVITTIDIWGDVAEKATCGQAEVRSIIPSGADPHNYSPSAQDIISFEDASLIAENGLGLEELMEDTLSRLPATLVIADLIEDEHDDEHDEDMHDEHDEDEHDEEDHDDEDHDEAHDEHDEDDHADDDHAEEDEEAHDHSGEDPHIWFDFDYARSFVHTLETRLAPVVADADALETCAENYITELLETEEDVAAKLASVPESRRILVTQHHTLERLADTHGYHIAGAVVPSTSTLAESDLRHLIELEERIRDTGAAALFVDFSGDNPDIETFADRVGLPLVVLYTESLGAPGSGADTYTGLMRTNANRIADALSAP